MIVNRQHNKQLRQLTQTVADQMHMLRIDLKARQ